MEVRADGVAVITITNPPVNVLSLDGTVPPLLRTPIPSSPILRAHPHLYFWVGIGFLDQRRRILPDPFWNFSQGGGGFNTVRNCVCTLWHRRSTRCFFLSIPSSGCFLPSSRLLRRLIFTAF
jgi:hypothetical protein